MSASSVKLTRLKKLSTEKLILRVNSWDAAIRKAKLRIQELKLAIEVFQEKKKVGEPWPE
ncbi:MAG TPA: hypothetical protein VEI49_03615 [Terriglobales bacterium]|nr:hypothetical protein [Terriglobales bacterium]